MCIRDSNKPIYGSDDDYDACCDDDDEYGDCDCDEETDLDSLAIRNYVENKHENEQNPTLKQFQSRMQGSELTCGEILDIVRDFGYYVCENYGSPRSMWLVEPNPNQ